jgi:Dyp-type peroxidase family
MIRTLRWPFSSARQHGLVLGDVQGNVLRPYGHPMAAHVFVQFSSPNGARALLREVLGEITHSDTWAEKPDSTLNVSFTYDGLQQLGLPSRLLATFPEAFRQGMAARAEILGDIDTSAPSEWDDGFGTGRIHALFSVFAGERVLDDAIERLTRRCTAHGVEVVTTQIATRLPDRKEHFGYADGMGQPALEGSGDPVRGVGDEGAFHTWHGLPVGEIFHGYVDDDGDPSPAPAGALGHGGTFQVWRKLHEDAATFRRWTAEQAEQLAMDRELLKAKLVGRWPDGSPLALTPDHPQADLGLDPDRVNDFDFADDPMGLRCPIGAHIRRVNPRAGLGFGDALTSRQRIVRRGMTYGPPLPPAAIDDDGADRGIFFVAFMADFERQFEFIQQNWCNSGDLLGIGADRDPFIGRAPGDHKFTIPGATPKFVHPIPDLVTTKGGEYLWVPSLRAVRALGEGAFLRPPSSVRHGRPQTLREVVQWVAGTALGVGLSPLAAGIGYATGRRPVHATGAAYSGVLEIPTPKDELLDGIVFDRPGHLPVVVRLSRGFSRPLRRRDVHGVAIRVLDAGGPGRHQDLLLATSKTGANGLEQTDMSMRYEPRFTSTLHLGSPNGPVLVVARPLQTMPDDSLVHGGAAGGLRFSLGVQYKGLEERQVGEVTLGAPLAADEAEALHFSIEHDWGGIQPWGVLNDARVVVYRAAAWGRSLRRRT